MELYLVGGAVRDLLLGRRPTDLDFAFDGSMADFLAAHPEAVRVGKSVDVCLWHGRECMPLRGGSLAADFEARDLTINALALDSAGRLHMHPQALEDLRNSLLRPASPTAFADDPTRIFRLARFAARWPSWHIDREAFVQMRALTGQQLAALPGFFAYWPRGAACCPGLKSMNARGIFPPGHGSGTPTACLGTLCDLWTNWRVMPWPCGWPFAMTSEKSALILPCCRTTMAMKRGAYRLPLRLQSAYGCQQFTPGLAHLLLKNT